METKVDTAVKPLATVEVKIPTVREWAISQGMSVGKRGRFSLDLLTKYADHFGLEIPKPANSKPSPVRDWATSQGMQISGQGRIPYEIVVAYNAAHNLPAPNSPKTEARMASPIRPWAVENGYTLPARGRFPLEVINAYNAAHGIDTVVPKTKAPSVKRTAKVKVTPPVVTDDRPARTAKVGGRSGGLYVCGFCATGSHERCPGVSVNGANVDHNTKCGCEDHSHG